MSRSLRAACPAAAVAAAGLALALLGGCSEDNESAVTKQARAGRSRPNPNAPPPPRTQAEYGQRQQQSSAYSKGSGYPGAK